MQQEQSLSLEERRVIEKFRKMRKEHIMPKKKVDFSEEIENWETVLVSDEEGKAVRIEELAERLRKEGKLGNVKLRWHIT